MSRLNHIINYQALFSLSCSCCLSQGWVGSKTRPKTAEAVLATHPLILAHTCGHPHIPAHTCREADGPPEIEPDPITIVLLNKEPDPIKIILLNKEPDQIIIQILLLNNELDHFISDHFRSLKKSQNLLCKAQNITLKNNILTKPNIRFSTSTFASMQFTEILCKKSILVI